METAILAVLGPTFAAFVWLAFRGAPDSPDGFWPAEQARVGSRRPRTAPGSLGAAETPDPWAGSRGVLR